MIREDVEQSLQHMYERGYKKGYEDALKEKSIDEVVQKIRTAIGVNLYEIASKFNESYGDAAIYLQELIDKAVNE